MQGVPHTLKANLTHKVVPSVTHFPSTYSWHELWVKESSYSVDEGKVGEASSTQTMNPSSLLKPLNSGTKLFTDNS